VNLHIVVSVETYLVDIERFGTVDVRHGDGNEFDLPVHLCSLPVPIKELRCKSDW
jgi:hypothetical protein